MSFASPKTNGNQLAVLLLPDLQLDQNCSWTLELWLHQFCIYAYFDVSIDAMIGIGQKKKETLKKKKTYLIPRCFLA